MIHNEPNRINVLLNQCKLALRNGGKRGKVKKMKTRKCNGDCWAFFKSLKMMRRLKRKTKLKILRYRNWMRMILNGNNVQSNIGSSMAIGIPNSTTYMPAKKGKIIG